MTLKVPCAEAIEDARAGTLQHIARFDDEATAYAYETRAIFGDKAENDPYAHLARAAEWSLRRTIARAAMTEAVKLQALLLAGAEEKQGRAADPRHSAWVRANAGTGKTHVLVQRILRLLLSGAEPRSILCLTFTKNAAAEMETRVLAKLGEWATASDADLKIALANLLARAPADAEMALARCLFAAVVDAPGGLAIMTIHGFCERVLRRYSFEANVPPGFAVLTEEEARDALAEASASAFASPSLHDALERVAAHAGEAEFARVLQAMLGQRSAIFNLLSVTAEEEPLAAIGVRLRPIFRAFARRYAGRPYRACRLAARCANPSRHR